MNYQVQIQIVIITTLKTLVRNSYISSQLTVTYFYRNIAVGAERNENFPMK